MSKNIKTVVYIELECDVDADFTPPEKGDPQTMDGPGSPNYDAELSIASINCQGVDIMRLLKRSELARISDDLLEKILDAEVENS